MLGNIIIIQLKTPAIHQMKKKKQIKKQNNKQIRSITYSMFPLVQSDGVAEYSDFISAAGKTPPIRVLVWH